MIDTIRNFEDEIEYIEVCLEDALTTDAINITEFCQRYGVHRNGENTKLIAWVAYNCGYNVVKRSSYHGGIEIALHEEEN